MMYRAILPALALSLMLGGAAIAQQAAPAAAPEPLSPADLGFIKDAATVGEFEIESGRLAQRVAANAIVKEFGLRMVRDHGNANAELTTIATAKGATMPSSLDAEHSKILTRLAGLEGARFDRAYIGAMLKEHDEDAKKFANEAENGKDEDVRSFARKTLPVIQEHGRLVHEIAQSMEAIGSSSP